MEDLAMHKIKIAVLWLFYVGAFLTVMILGMLEPGALDEFIKTGTIDGMKAGPELSLLFSILLLVPLVMAFLSLTLKKTTNRWANIILGIVFTVIQLFALIETLAQPSAWTMLMELSKVAAVALIVWYAWKWVV